MTDISRSDQLENKHFWGYAVGHFINDLSGNTWINFSVFFLKRVVQTDAASPVFLIGQATDGISTPLIGYLSDKSNTRIGKRTPWYILGLIMTTISYLPLFYNLQADQAVRFWYYTCFAIIYTISWAAIQVSHMSLVPSLTQSRQRRDKLNNLRTSFIYLANFTALCIGLVIFQIMDDPPLQFLLIVLISQVIGTIMSLIFLCTIREKRLSVDQISEKESQSPKLDSLERTDSLNTLQKSLLEEQQEDPEKKDENQNPQFEEKKEQIHEVKQTTSICMWFRMPSFYLFCLCYIGMRIFYNVFAALTPFYLVDVLQFGSDSEVGLSFNLALVPLLVYASAIITSSRLSALYSLIGRKKTLLVGSITGSLSLLVMYFLTPDVSWIVYILAVLIGSASGLVVSTGINLISEVVGKKSKQGAFVFGFYSFLDKTIVGLTVALVTSTEAFSREGAPTEEQIDFIRITVTAIPALACIIGTLSVLFYPIPEYKSEQSEKLLSKQ